MKMRIDHPRPARLGASLPGALSACLACHLERFVGDVGRRCGRQRAQPASLNLSERLPVEWQALRAEGGNEW